jgi:hypothetical protein
MLYFFAFPSFENLQEYRKYMYLLI